MTIKMCLMIFRARLCLCHAIGYYVHKNYISCFQIYASSWVIHITLHDYKPSIIYNHNGIQFTNLTFSLFYYATYEFVSTFTYLSFQDHNKSDSIFTLTQSPWNFFFSDLCGYRISVTSDFPFVVNEKNNRR